MKKLFPLALALLLLLSACSITPPSLTSTPSPTPTVTATPTPTPAANTLTLEKYIEVMDSWLSKKDMPTFSSVAPESGEESDDGLIYDYFLDNYNLVTVETDSSGKYITKIYIFLASKTAPKEEITLFGYLFGASLGMINSDNGDTISNELQFTDIVNEGSRFSFSDNADYLYTVDDGLTILAEIK